MKRSFFTIFTLLLLLNTAHSQNILNRAYHPFSGTLVLSINGGVSFASTDYSTMSMDYLGRADLEYYFPAYTKSLFGIRVFGTAGYMKGTDESKQFTKFRTSFSTVGGGVIYAISVGDVFFPYFFAGAGLTKFDPKSELGNKLPNNFNAQYETKEVNYIGEVGFKIPVVDNLSLNFNANVQLSPNDNFDDIKLNANNDILYYAAVGLTFSFFNEVDSDKDGVVDSKDNCPGTIEGVKVDMNGCPIDSDKDGVYDYLDKCPDTPQDVNVDIHGCPKDSDKDKVPDYIDLCPNTPPGIKVDEFGCPFDLDADGIYDYMDKCPNTPYNVQVDEHGCPKDADKDGVPDYLDQCPESLPGDIVDAKGCKKIVELPKVEVKVEAPKDTTPVIKQLEVKEFTLSSDKLFANEKSVLTASAFPLLDPIVKIMKDNPLSRWKIEGFTDNKSKSKEKDNLKLSQLRAAAVMNYFISKGIPKIRFESAGYGSRYPAGDNKTEKGRTLNRRIKIYRVN